MSRDAYGGASEGLKYGLNIRGLPKKPVVQKPKVPVANAFQADSDDVRPYIASRPLSCNNLQCIPSL